MERNTWDKILSSFKSVGILHLFKVSQDFTKNAFMFVYNTEYTRAERTFSALDTKQCQ